jgi:hypothetical protein
MVERVEYQLFEKFGHEICGPLFLCLKPGCIIRLGKACAVHEAPPRRLGAFVSMLACIMHISFPMSTLAVIVTSNTFCLIYA